MIVHELATNAAKYGGLSASGGSLRIDWRVEADRRLRVIWTENGGPPAIEPTITSTGTAVIRNAVKQLDGKLDREWSPSGLRCVLSCQV